MRDLVFICWNLDGNGGVKAAQRMLQRCDLRHEAHQELDVPMDDPDTDEPWSTGSYGWVRLPKEDPRIPRLLEELRALGEKPLTRTDRIYTKKERDSAPWLVVSGATTMLGVGSLTGQPWDFKRACPTCGAGAVPVPPLIARLDRMPKNGWSLTSPDGLVIVSNDLAARLLQAKLTGFELRSVRTPSRELPDGRFRWLHVTSGWPAPTSHPPTCRLSPPCAQCGRPVLLWSEPRELHCDAAPADTCDFNAWQGGVLPDRFEGRPNRPTGTAEVILSNLAYRVLKDAGVSSLRCNPVYIAGNPAKPSTATKRRKQ